MEMNGQAGFGCILYSHLGQLIGLHMYVLNREI